jgi:hypothetical protein
MGWKASVIIVNKPTQVDNEELLKDLGFINLTKIKDELFEVAMNPKNKTVYIGSYKDNLLICDPDIPMLYFGEEETTTEKFLKQKFPNSEICSITLNSVVNLWAYSVTKNGQKLRAKAGSSEDGTFLEFGEPLDEEKELLSKSKLDKNGNRIYIFDNSPDQPFDEDQVGENLVFSICQRYFGEELDSADDLLYETTLTGYKYKKINASNLGQHETVDNKPWWKIW